MRGIGTEQVKIGFAYNIKDPAFNGTDTHAEYETPETIAAIAGVLSRYGDVVHRQCDSDLPGRLIDERPDVVFNIAEGWGGRDRESFVPVLCEMLEIPFSGSDATALGITMDKALTKRIAHDAGVRTTDFALYDRLPEKPPGFGFPAFAKPALDGSSRGIFADSRVEDFAALREKVESLMEKYEQPVLVEPYLDGREFCVGVIGNDPPRVLPTCEISLGHESGIPFFSHEYKSHDRDRIDFDPSINDNVIEEMESSALEMWNILKLRDYSRFDFRTDAKGRPHLLEINALPGLSPVSGIFVRQAERAAMDYSACISTVAQRIISMY